MESHLQKAILGIVTLAASGTEHVAAPRRPLAVVVLCDGKGHPTAAGDEKHLQASVLIGFFLVSGCGGWFHDCSTAA
jgi:hypothetical protein